MMGTLHHPHHHSTTSITMNNLNLPPFCKDVWLPFAAVAYLRNAAASFEKADSMDFVFKKAKSQNKVNRVD